MTQNIFRTGMEVAQGLQGLQDQRYNSDMTRMQNEQQAQAQQAQAQQAQMLDVLKQQYADSGDPAIMRQIIMMDSEVGKDLKTQFDAIDTEAQNATINEAAAFKQMIETNPEQAGQYFQQNLADNPFFASLADDFAAGDYENAIDEIGFGITRVAGQETFDNIFNDAATPVLKETGSGYRLYDAETGTFSSPSGDVPLTPDQAKTESERLAADLKLDDDAMKRADDLRKEIISRAKNLGVDGTFAAMNRIEASNDGTAAGDLALIFNYMKMLDPGSVVREGEFATAQNAAGVPQRVKNLYNQAINGERLSEPQRKEFSDTARKIYNQAQESFQQVIQPYLDLGAQSNLTQEQILGENFFGSLSVANSDNPVTQNQDSGATNNNQSSGFQPYNGPMSRPAVSATENGQPVTRNWSDL